MTIDSGMLSTFVVMVVSGLMAILGFFIRRDVARVDKKLDSVDTVESEWRGMSGQMKVLADKLAPTLEEVAAIRASQKRSWVVLEELRERLEALEGKK